MSVLPINPINSNDDNLAPELPKQEPIKPEKKEKIVDEQEKREQQVFDEFSKKESTDENKSEIPQDMAQFQDMANKVISEAIKQGGSVGTINFQFGGVSAGNLYSSGHVVGGNQVNNQGVSSPSSANISSGIDYAAMPINSRIKQWFEDHQAIHYRSLMISMAFLNGSDLASVNSLRDKLESALRSKSKADDKEIDKESDKFKNLEFGKRFKIILAHTEKRIENREFGGSQFEVILFDTPDFQEALLKYIWEEQDYYWRITLDCLMEVSTEHSSQTKVRLAAALSESCKYRFDLVRELVLLPLAKSDNPVQRGITALCLGITALGDGDFSPQQARNLLSHWSTLKNSPNIRKTSTEAYSLYVGLKFLDEAFDRFLTIAKSNDVVFLLDILEGIVTLFERSESIPENRLAILKHLETWLNYSEKESPHKVAAHVTWGIMKMSNVSVQELNVKKLPTLFWLSKNDEKAEKTISSLIRCSLNLKMTRSLVIQQLEIWFNLAEKEPELRQTLGKVITRIIKYGNAREKERLQLYLNRWASQGKSYAFTLLTYLHQKGLII